jgi:hypothetical protein
MDKEYKFILKWFSICGEIWFQVGDIGTPVGCLDFPIFLGGDRIEKQISIGPHPCSQMIPEKQKMIVSN